MNRAVALIALAALCCACQSVPYTGRSHIMLVSDGKEKDLGAQAYKEILAKAQLSPDQADTELIRKVGLRLSQVAEKPDFQWEFNLISDDQQINAFCLPGGKVAFYTGILPVAQGEDGIAVVMSHEIAHALARHGAERMSQGMIVNAGGQLLGAAVGARSPQEQKLYREFYSVGTGVGFMLPYSRKHESEADKIGLILMAKAGYDPAQGLLFWKRMEEATSKGRKDDPLAKFMSTHPTSVDRQRQIQDWLPEIKRQYYRP
ncbi:MAG: hypothetical protein A2X36_12140 [Elusimicrobia bacterium GWA2_69_24]|nr:MAG: hypothetical protein A2X36_12140 [Elusimicrobia bacterium GWA2_69_24]HBL18868.1 peptidase M48 family protein [Elusimicrobiota bacterium]